MQPQQDLILRYGVFAPTALTEVMIERNSYRRYLEIWGFCTNMADQCGDCMQPRQRSYLKMWGFCTNIADKTASIRGLSNKNTTLRV